MDARVVAALQQRLHMLEQRRDELLLRQSSQNTHTHSALSGFAGDARLLRKIRGMAQDFENERAKQASTGVEGEGGDDGMVIGGGDCLELVGVNSSLTYAAVRYFEYENAGSVTVKQDISDVGGTVWDAAVILSHFVDEIGLKHVRDKTVIELGAGTGLPGLVCARLGALETLLTERASVLPITAAAVTDNLDAAQLEAVQMREFLWGSASSEIFAPGKAYDLVLGADLVYDFVDNPAYLDELVASITQLLQTNRAGGAVCYLAYEQRRNDLVPFFDKFLECRCTRLSTPMLEHAYRVCRVKVYEIKLK